MYGRMYSMTGCDFWQRLDRAREGDARALGEQRLLLRQVDQVVARARCFLIRKRRSRIVGSRVGHERPQRAEERRQVLRGGLRLGDEHVEVAQRRAQVHERRVRLAERGRKQPERARERDVLVADRRASVAFAFETRSARSSRRSAIAPTTVAVSTTKRSKRSSSRISSRVSREAGRERGVEVLGRLVGLLGLAVVLGRAALDDLLEALRGSSGRAC